MRRRLLVLASLLTSVLALTAVPADAATGRYVALGDSFTAGPLIPNLTGWPLGCGRSDHNYPSLAAAKLKPGKFVDVSCGGAVIDHMTESQVTVLGTNPPQFNALTRDTDLVTVGISGNDVGFGTIAVDCSVRSVSDPQGAPCKEHYGDSLEQRVTENAPRMAGVLRGIKERSPSARVIVVGYLRLLPDQTGCWPVVPIARGDVPYLDKLEESLNGMLERQARANGAGFVDAYANSTGHDMCAPIGSKWVEGILPTQPAAPVHPNAAGMAEVATRLLAALGT